MKTNPLKQSLLLLLAATIWGTAFVAQSVGMEYVGTFTFTTIRNVIGAFVLLPYIYIRSKDKTLGNKSVDHKQRERKLLLLGGLQCGFFLFVATNLQQIGIKYTTIGKAGFITAMYIVLVPLVGLFFHKKVGLRIWLGVFIAVVGLYLLCMNEAVSSIAKGDIMLILCALVFTFQILSVDHYAPKVDCVKLACLQFVFCSIFSAVCMPIFEHPTMSAIMSAWLPILYAGALSSGIAYTLQIVGQRGLNPTIASLVMSLESVISLLAGWLLLNQKLSAKELMGCLVMFTAIVIVQLPDRRKRSQEIQ